MPTSLPSLKLLLRHALHLLLPARCIACGTVVDRAGSICGNCWKDLAFISSNACATCGHPFEVPVPDGTLCGACIADPPEYARARSALAYDDIARPLITRFKYGDALHGTETFARWMNTCGHEALKNADAIVPVPLHRLRLLERRYNQSSLLANALGKQVSLPVLHQALIRRKHTEAQAGLSKSARAQNVKHAFRVKEKSAVAGKHLVLIDDVMTTGATVRECSRVLLKSGAASVSVLTLARTTIPQ